VPLKNVSSSTQNLPAASLLTQINNHRSFSHFRLATFKTLSPLRLHLLCQWGLQAVTKTPCYQQTPQSVLPLKSQHQFLESSSSRIPHASLTSFKSLTMWLLKAACPDSHLLPHLHSELFLTPVSIHLVLLQFQVNWLFIMFTAQWQAWSYYTLVSQEVFLVCYIHVHWSTGRTFQHSLEKCRIVIQSNSFSHKYIWDVTSQRE
jgi:hypothetical protein